MSTLLVIFGWWVFIGLIACLVIGAVLHWGAADDDEEPAVFPPPPKRRGTDAAP